MFDQHVIFLDLETTGGSAIDDRIIEIGIVEVAHGHCVGEWSTLINPGRRIPHGIQVLTGITDEMLAAAPTFEAVSATLAARLEGKVLAAHNARFDYGFLKSQFARAGLRYTAQVLCTVKLSRLLYPHYRRHNLDALIMRHAIFCLDRHRALGDARVLWELAQLWRADPGEETLNAASAALLTRPAVPAGLPADVFDTLPESRGVYIFYGDDDRALYVGRSANIRSRVLAHFSAAQQIGKDLRIAEEVRRVDWLETSGELGATLHESRLVRQLAPVYNRKLSEASEVCAWRWRIETPDRAPELVTALALDRGELQHLYGLFRSRASARQALRGLAKAYGLCHAVLGLERPESSGACAAYALDQCRGACVGAESRISHAMRVVQALSALRLEPWPYPGRIGIRERSAAGERSELHLVDDWCYLGTAKTEADLHDIADTARGSGFDFDTYKMLARFLKSPPASCDILALSTP
jgi:DNA polymerase-3 subunit epsilon